MVSVWSRSVVTAELGMDGIRGYIKQLRAGQKISHQKVADAIGVGRRTVIDWETGETKELRLGPVFRITKFLGGSYAHIEKLLEEQADQHRGEELAKEYLGSVAFKNLERLAEDGNQDVVDTIREMQEELNRLKRRVGLLEDDPL